MAGLVRLGWELTDSCLWVFGDVYVEQERTWGAWGEGKGKQNLSEACPNGAASKRTPVMFPSSSIHSSIHPFIFFFTQQTFVVSNVQGVGYSVLNKEDIVGRLGGSVA